jgi:TolB-like protein
LPGPDIFLSYNREDAAAARFFADGFGREGLNVWWDATLRSGETYDEVTETALRNAKAVVVLWSPRSVASHWVRAEATIAHRAGTLVPATIEACDKPVMFELTQTAELSHWRGQADDRVWLAFLEDVRRRIGREAPIPVEATASPVTVAAGFGIPVVAFFPIAHRSGDMAMELLADDLTEDFTRELSQSFYCKVIAASTMAVWRGKTADHRALKRELGARYAIECRLQEADENLRLAVQLIDTETDNMLWSSRYAAMLDGITKASEQFVRSVAIELDQKIGSFEIASAQSKRPPCTAWEHILRSFGFMGINVPGAAHKAVEEVQYALAVAPDFGLAHAALAHALGAHLLVDRLTISDAERPALVREVRDRIKRAIELDGNNPLILTRLANAYGLLGDAEAGLRLAQRAVQLAPNSSEALHGLAFSYFMLGRTSETIELLTKQELSGLSNNFRLGWQSTLGICLFIEGRSEEAEVAIDNALAIHPNYYVALRWKAIVAAELGKEESARAAVRLLREAEPGKSVDDYLDSPRHLPIEHPRKYEGVAILRRLLEETQKGV